MYVFFFPLFFFLETLFFNLNLNTRLGNYFWLSAREKESQFVHTKGQGDSRNPNGESRKLVYIQGAAAPDEDNGHKNQPSSEPVPQTIEMI